MSTNTTTPPSMEDLVYDNNMDYVSSLSPTLFYLVLLMVSGLVGNTLVFVVYYRRFKPSVTRTYILAMSVSDLTTNCLALPSDIYEIRFHYDFQDDAGCKFFGFITRLLALQCAFMLIAIAVDRRKMICQSTKKPRSLRQVYVELTCLAVFAACYAIPFGVLRGLQTVPVPGSNDTGTTCSIDDVYVGSLLFVIYNGSMGLVFIICVIIMAVCYALIGMHLWRHKKRLLHNAKRRQHSTPPGGDMSHRRQKRHERAAGDKGATGFSEPCGVLPEVQGSSGALTDEQSGDEGDRLASRVKVQLNVTQESDQSGATSDVDNTTDGTHLQISGVVSMSSLTNASESETSATRLDTTTSFSGDISTDDSAIAGGGESGGEGGGEEGGGRGEGGGVSDTTVKAGPPKLSAKNFRKAAMVANASHCHAVASSEARDEERRAKANCQSKKKKQKKKKGPAMTAGVTKRMPRRTTLMMFVLAAMFVVSYLPYLFMAALYRGKDLVGAGFWTWNLHQIALRSFFINSAVNPLVYSFCSVKFRRECCVLLGRK